VNAGFAMFSAARPTSAGLMAAPATPPGMQDKLYGVVRLGAMLAALSIHYIREVVPRPETLLPFPATMPEIVGAIELRGAVIPVLDLGRMLAGGGQTGDASVIMLLRIEGQVFGIFIHEICGVVELGVGSQTPVTIAGSASPMVVSGFAHGARHGVVLDALRIAALPGLATAQERTIAMATAAEVGAPMLMFCAGKFDFGLAARFIEACVPRVPASPSPVDDPLWIGMIAYNGRRVAVVDTLRLLGLGSMEPAREYACVVIRMPGGLLLALRIENVGNILRIPAEAQLPLQDFSIGQRHLLSGMHEGERLSLLIDGNALQAEASLMNVAGLEEREAALGALRKGQAASADQDAAAQSHSARNSPFLIVSAGGGRFAIPLGQVEEILPGQAKSRVGLSAQFNGIVGMIVHRACAIPLYDLAEHLGMWGAGGDADYILLASAGGRRMGFLLDGLSAVERTQVQQLAAARAGTQQGLPSATIRASDGTTCMVLDLQSVIEGMDSGEDSFSGGF
jgi:purine-binding chemotaxis protein CheW